MVKPLSQNERKVLKLLIEQGRMKKTEIAKEMGISSQAVKKIKEKLKAEGVIKGYTVEIDYEKIGVNLFAVALFKFKSGSWTSLENEDIKKRVKGPHIIRVYRLSEGDITHIVVYGFRSMKEVENYFQTLQTERGHISELKKLYVLSSSSILKDSPNELLIKVINEMGAEKLARPEKPIDD